MSVHLLLNWSARRLGTQNFLQLKFFLGFHFICSKLSLFIFWYSTSKNDASTGHLDISWPCLCAAGLDFCIPILPLFLSHSITLSLSQSVNLSFTLSLSLYVYFSSCLSLNQSLLPVSVLVSASISVSLSLLLYPGFSYNQSGMTVGRSVTLFFFRRRLKMYWINKASQLNCEATCVLIFLN